MAYNNELPSYATLLEFQEVYLRAVALAWNDLIFYEAFVNGDSLGALEKWFGYKCPWNINLRVKDNGGKWKAKEKRWKKLDRNKIIIGLPQKPAENKDQAIALAAYNDSGPTYLFTCC